LCMIATKESHMEKRAEEVRKEVSKAYAEAVTRPVTKGSCCGGPSPQKGAVVSLAGYAQADLAGVPQEAAINSFGCGDPVALASLGPGEVVLDLGSGAGIDLFLAAQKVGPSGRVIGVDMTDEMIAKANENIEAGKYANVEVRKGIIEALPVESGSVDWVISNCVINLSPEKPRVFAEIARVLKPGGRMLVSDIVAEDLPHEVRESAVLYSSCVAGAISETDYLAGLRKAGLTDVEVRARLVYDATQLEAFAASESESLCCCGPGSAKLSEIARSLSGKIWSAKIYARKPE
jgi:arsenite methyltransferase